MYLLLYTINFKGLNKEYADLVEFNMYKPLILFKPIKRVRVENNPYGDVYFAKVYKWTSNTGASVVRTTLRPFMKDDIFVFKLLHEKLIYPHKDGYYNWIDMAQKEYLSKAKDPIRTKDYIVCQMVGEVHIYIVKQVFENEALDLIFMYEPVVLWEASK